MIETAFLFTTKFYKLNLLGLLDAILDVCLITLGIFFFLFSAERKLNQDAILKVITDSAR